MAKNTPAFQFYPADFLGGTALLSDAATGIYIKMLCSIWISGGELPYCTRTLARACQTTPEEFDLVWSDIKDKFVIDQGSVTHARLADMIRISKERAKAGAKGGSKSNSTSTAKRKQQGSKRRTKPLKNEERRMKNEVCSLESDDWIIPDGWDCAELRSALDSFEEMRFSINKRIKSKSQTSKIFSRFDSADHLIYALELCVANQYQGLKPDYRPSGRSGKSGGKDNLLFDESISQGRL